MSGIKDTKGELIGGLFGTAIATMGMFCTGIFILSMSGFGPIADNAGGKFFYLQLYFLLNLIQKNK